MNEKRISDRCQKLNVTHHYSIIAFANTILI